MTQRAIVFAPGGEIPEPFGTWLADNGLSATIVRSGDELIVTAMRGRPLCVLFDALSDVAEAFTACAMLKADSFAAVVPVAVACGGGDETFVAAYRAGADEVLAVTMGPMEARARLTALLTRSERDTTSHASTRLPGASRIEAEVARRIEAGTRFAMCYADLDHFKEFNDRYGYADGDRVIGIVARILHDVIRGVCGIDGFVGHVGGDDFIFVVPAAAVAEVCGTIIEIFDTLIELQYSVQDRRLGYFIGKDRRGNLHRVPLMTISIGVATNERRVFAHAREVSSLAAEMKAYAKTLPGSVYAIDRRMGDDGPGKREAGDNVKDDQVADIE